MSSVGHAARDAVVGLPSAPHAAQYLPVLLHHVAPTAVVEVPRVLLTVLPIIFLFVVLASEML